MRVLWQACAGTSRRKAPGALSSRALRCPRWCVTQRAHVCALLPPFPQGWSWVCLCSRTTNKSNACMISSWYVHRTCNVRDVRATSLPTSWQVGWKQWGCKICVCLVLVLSAGAGAGAECRAVLRVGAGAGAVAVAVACAGTGYASWGERSVRAGLLPLGSRFIIFWQPREDSQRSTSRVSHA